MKTNSGGFTLNAWTHWVVTSSSAAVTIYGNGASVASESPSGNSLTVTTRSNLNIGASLGTMFFSGSVAYLRIYNDIALDSTAVAALYAAVHNCRAGWYGGAGSCYTCAADTYTAASGSASCTACAAGKFSSARSPACA